MAGPQDYLTVKGPEGASYQLPKFDLGSQIASLPTSYQEGQQYGIKRALQTMFQNNPDLLKPDPTTGQLDLGAIATNAMKIGGPEAATPFFNMMMQQQGSVDFNKMMGGGGAGGQPAPQGGQGNPPQTFTPMAPNSATGPSGITGEHPSTGGGSIFPYKPGTSPPQIVAGGPQGGTGLGGQPAPFAGNRDQQGAPPGPVGGGTFNDRIPSYGGMSNRPTVAEDGTTGQPTAPTSARETANNGLPDISNDPVISRQRKIIDIASNFLGTHPVATPGQIAGAKARIDEAQKAIEQRTDLLNKNAELTTGEKEAKNPSVAAAAGAVEAAKTGAAADTKYYDTVYRGLTGSATIAAQQKQNIALLRQIAESPNFMPGMGSELALGYQRLAAQFGINPTGAAPREVFNQLAARVLADQFSGMKSLASETGEQGARIFKPMLDIEERANITPNDSLEGVRAKLNLLDRSGDLMMRYGDMADDYKTSHGKLDASFNKTIRAEIAGSRMGAVMPAASGAIQVAPAGQKSKAEVLEWASKMGLKSGDKFRTPAGDVRYIP